MGGDRCADAARGAGLPVSGLDAGTAERSLRLLDWISALIARWPEPDWSAAVSREVEELVDARRSALAAQDWSAEEDGADLVVEVQLRDPVPLDCKEPAPAVAVAPHRSSASSAQNCGYARSRIPTRVCGSGTADAGRAAALAPASEIIGSTCCARRPGEA